MFSGRRRRVIWRGIALTVSAAVALALAPTAATSKSGIARRSARRTTLQRSIVGVEGERRLEYGPGHPRVTRTLGWKHRRGRGRALVGFKQLSDIHVVDEESPGRVEYFDACSTPFQGAYRVQEPMSTQIGDSMLRKLRRIKNGPATGVPLSFAISTGDNVDNNQENETEWFVRLLDGRRVSPNSGAATYDGYTREQYSEALETRIIEMAQQPFDAVGTGIPWYGVLGNHDGLVQGNAPKNPQFEAIVTSGTKAFTRIDGYTDCPSDPNDLQEITDIIGRNFFAPTARSVPADAKRRFLGHEDLVEEYFQSPTRPQGHGFGRAPTDPIFDSTAGYYTFPMGRKVLGISLDSISYQGGPNGNIPNPQFEWLERQLQRNSKRYFTSGGTRKRNRNARNKLIVLFSHHSSVSLDNPSGSPEAAPIHCFERTDAPECAEGEGLKDLIHRYPNVIAWVNGHEHNNAVRPYPAPRGQDKARGFWEINTAAHIDWPQQSRLIEIAYKPGRTRRRADAVFVFGTTVDHRAPLKPNEARQTRLEFLTSIARLESYVDACIRTGQASCDAGGRRRDRNVKLVSKAPFNLGHR